MGGFGFIDAFNPYFQLADLVPCPKIDRNWADLVGGRYRFCEDELLSASVNCYGDTQAGGGCANQGGHTAELDWLREVDDDLKGVGFQGAHWCGIVAVKNMGDRAQVQSRKGDVHALT